MSAAIARSIKSRCKGEADLAERSRRRLSQLLSQAGQVRLEPTGRMSYDRQLAQVLVDGRDVGAILVAEGLATRERHDRVDWCRR